MPDKKRQFSYVILAFVLSISTSALGVDFATVSHPHRGTVVTVSTDKLIIQGFSEKKKQHTYDVIPTAVIFRERHPCILADIQVGE